MLDVKKPLRRSKSYALERLKQSLGHVAFDKLDRDRLIDFGRDRAKDGAGPATVGSEISYINTVITHAGAVHGGRACRSLGIEDLHFHDLRHEATSRL